MVALSLTVPHGAGETATSLASRLAAQNLQPHVRIFCSDVGLEFSHLVDGRHDVVEKLVALAGACSEEVSASTFVREGGKTFRLNGQRITSGVLERQALICCPRCLIEDMDTGPFDPEVNAFGRAIWNIVPYRTCPEHEIALARIGDMPVPARTHDFTFLVNQNAETLRRAADEAEQRTPSEFELYLLERIQGIDRAPLWLDELDFSAAAKTCEMFGVIAMFGTHPNLHQLTSADWARAAAAGFDILRNGWTAAREFLSALQRAPGLNANSGSQEMFGRLYQWLAFGGKDHGVDPVRDLVREHIVETMPVGSGETILGETIERRVHSVRTLAKQTGLHPKTIRKALNHSGLLEGAKDRSDHFMLAPADEAEHLLTRMTEALTPRDVRSYINISRTHLAQIIQGGFLSPVIEAEGMDRLYHPSDLAAFLGKLTGGAELVDSPAPGQVTLTEAVKRACCKTTDLIGLLLEKRLDWVGVMANQTGYDAILVDVDQVRSKLKLPPVEGITVTGVSRDLGITDAAARYLLESGVLRQETVMNPVNKCPMQVVPPADYQEFKANYISLRDVGRIRGQSSRAALRDLERLGASPISEWRDHGAIFFRRSTLS